MTMNLRLRLLGPVQVERAGQPVPSLQSGLRLALLGYLIAQRQPLPREHLADLLWQDLPAERGRANLSWTAHKLSAALPGCLQTDRHTVGFQCSEGCWIDLDAFEALAKEQGAASLSEAAALYRGPFLEGLSLHNCADYELWLVGERERWRRRAEQVLDALIARHGERGRREDALLYAQRLLALAPWREGTHRQVMRLLAESGQRGAALAQYETCHRILAEELGVEPGEETSRLYRQIRDGDLVSETNDTAYPISLQECGDKDNLPAQITSFVGRAAQLDEVRELLARPGVRLLTLTGAGGTGKTRLALQVAAGLFGTYPDGVVFVPLAPVRDPGLVSSAIAERLGVRESAESTLLDALKYVLHERDTLLLLDNFEHVASAAPVVSELLAAAPRLHMLITSRAPLHVYGEHEYAVLPMEIPSPCALPPLEHLAEVEAVQLFLQRALQVRSGFALDAGNAAAVAEICVQLDGLPLAIELAAARVKYLSPQVIRRRLDDRLGFLTGGPKDMPARQRALRATIEWSYELLTPDEQVLFRRLAVFFGGFTSEAAEAVSVPHPPNLDGLDSLLDQNLLQASEHGGESRFAMLETIREYASEQLVQAGESASTRERHARFFVALAEAAAAEGYGATEWVWLDRLQAEYANLQAALAWSIDNDVQVALRLAGALGRFWYLRGYLRQGRDWLVAALARFTASGPKADRWRAEALSWAGYLRFMTGHSEWQVLLSQSADLWREVGETRGLAWTLGRWAQAIHGREPGRAHALLEEAIALVRKANDTLVLAYALAADADFALNENNHERARAHAEESMTLARTVGVIQVLAWANGILGRTALARGDLTTARTSLDTCVALFRESRDKTSSALWSPFAGDVRYLQGDYGTASVCYQENLESWREIGLKYCIAGSLIRLAHVALCQGEWDEARSHLKEALALCREMARTGSRDAVGALVGCAGLAQAQGQPERATRLLGAAVALQASADGELTPAYVPLRDRVETTLRTELDEAAFAAAWREGEVMAADGGERAVAYALGEEI